MRARVEKGPSWAGTIHGGMMLLPGSDFNKHCEMCSARCAVLSLSRLARLYIICLGGHHLSLLSALKIKNNPIKASHMSCLCKIV